MIFFPYRVDLSLHRLPYATIAISIVCLVVFYQQFHNSQSVRRDTYWFCQRQPPRLFRMVMNNTYGHYSARDCAKLMWGIRMSDAPDDYIKGVVGKGDPLKGFKPDSARLYAAQLVRDEYSEFERRVPAYDTQSLWYKPDSWNPVAMVTAAFAHASWMHVIGNLVFFFAFAASVEIIVGWWQFLLLILALALGTHAFYSVSMLAVDNPPPTVGLSGVVMGMMGLLAFFLPRGRIRCFLWAIVVFKRFTLPAWLLFAWFAGWDTYTLFFAKDHHGINVVAHVSGAGLAMLIGYAFYRPRRREIRELEEA